MTRKDLAVRASKEMGKIVLDNFGKSINISSKGDRDLVTNIDKKAEKIILSLIRKYYPEDGIISEESPHSRTRSGYSWIIDPIDGTHNFIHHIAIFGSSIALAFKNQVILGVIYLPPTDELYVAEKGKGAYRNGKRISVSKRKINQATLVYDSSIRLQKAKMLDCLGALADKVFNLRMFGSTVRSLAYVAEGRAEAEIEFNDKLWDFAAGLLLVEEAGGQGTDFSGRPWSINTQKYIASNGIIHKAILETIKG